MPGLLRCLMILCFMLMVLPWSAAAQETAPAMGPAWHLSLGGSIHERRDLVEHYQFTPTAAIAPGQANGWERKWSEQRAGVSLAHDLLAGEHWLLQPRAGLGLSQVWFSAANNGLRFSETWRSRPGLYWTAGAGAELRAAPTSGPFLRLGYDYAAARLVEESESIVSPGSGSNGNNRDAVFRWQEQEISLRTGWRLGAWTPTAGISILDWRLQKTLTHHIPETSGTSPRDLEMIRLLNSGESAYHYHNGRAWSPLVGLAWTPAPDWSLEIGGRLGSDPALSLSLEVSF